MSNYIKRLKAVHSNTLPIASIHATILSIFLAVFSAYFFHQYANSQQLEKEVLQKAEQINEIFFKRYAYTPNSKTRYNAPQNLDDTLHLVDHFYELTWGWDDFSPYYDNPKEPTEKIERLLQYINIVVHSYPFRNSFIINDGKIGGKKYPESIHFKNVDEARIWVKDIDKFLNQTRIFVLQLSQNRLGKNFNANLQAFITNKKESINNTQLKRSSDIHGLTDPILIFQDFITNMNHTQLVVNSVSDQIQILDVQKYKNLPKWILITIVSVVSLIFFLGVFLPIIKPQISKHLYITIPFASYFIALSILICRLSTYL